MKKYILMALCMLLVGCSTPTQEKKETTIDINSIEWTVEEGIVDGKRMLVFNYTNNSPYPISQIGISFSKKENLTDEELACFDAFKDEMSDEEIKTEPIEAYSHAFVLPGEDYKNGEISMNYTPITNLNQYNTVEPDFMYIEYYTPEYIYTDCYDFKNEKMVHDDIEAYISWGEEAAAKAIPQYEANLINISISDDTHYSCYVYRQSKEQINAYIDLLLENGYTNNQDKSSNDWWITFSSDNNEYKVNLHYTISEESLIISVDKLEE